VAVVYIPALLRASTGGLASLEAPGATVREVVDYLEQQYPGVRSRLLGPNVAIAIDGEISTLGVLEPVSPSSEIHFVAAIRGGSTHTTGIPVGGIPPLTLWGIAQYPSSAYADSCSADS
jgi:sulfur-carrier protein